jgi:hypothetical protein
MEKDLKKKISEINIKLEKLYTLYKSLENKKYMKMLEKDIYNKIERLKEIKYDLLSKEK